MTNEEAKEYILQNYFDGDENVTASSGDEEIEALKCAVGALEKQIPKKPISEERGNYCPFCSHEQIDDAEDVNVYYPHCFNCGQKLDWSGF